MSKARLTNDINAAKLVDRALERLVNALVICNVELEGQIVLLACAFKLERGWLASCGNSNISGTQDNFDQFLTESGGSARYEEYAR